MEIENKNSLIDIDEQIQRLNIEKSVLWDKLVSSSDPDDIIKAISYNSSRQSSIVTPDQRGYLFAPDGELYTGSGYKIPVKNVPFEYLRSMAETPLISPIIGTRINQVLEFSNFQSEMDRPGWTIRRRQSRFDKEYKLSDTNKKEIDRIATFLENGGEDAKFSLHTDFHDFLKMFPKDSLELDHAAFEVQRTRGGDLVNYECVDSATIRFLETIDPNFTKEEKYRQLNYKGQSYWPYYCQVWRERVLVNPKSKEDIIWYPWEMCVAVRNKSTNIMRNGYGTSELEILLRIVTWMLESLEYNGRFFTNGSHPRGFFTMKGGVNQNMLNDFRMAWRSMVTGWQNAHKLPIFEADKIDWVNMQQTNKEMEFSQWLEFLVLIAASVYKIDPSEMGFRFKQQGSIFGEQGQKERLDYSKDKGLKPLLKVIQKSVDKYIVSEISDGYEFVFTGIDLEDEDAKLDRDVKKVANGFVAMQDKFREYSGREFDPDKDIILNSIYQQSKMQAMYGGQEANNMVDQEMGGKEVGARNPYEEFEQGDENKNPFEQYEKSLSDNPIMDETMKYMKNLFSNG